MKRVGINASFLRKPSTGIGQVTIHFLKELAKRENDFEIFLYLEDDYNFDFSNKFTKRVFLPLWKRDDLIRKIWWEKYLLPKKIKEDNIDVFLSLYQSSTILAGDINHVMLVHDIVPKLFPEYLGNSRKRLYWELTEKGVGKASRIVTVSENSKKDLIKYLNIAADRIKVALIDVDSIYKKEVDENYSKNLLDKYNLKKGYIYSGGGMEKRKNLDTLILAYKKMLEENSSIPDLVISGKPLPGNPLAVDVSGMVKDLEIEDRVRILGYVSQEDVPAIHKNAKMFIYPSKYEGFGMPLLEALSQGTPSISAKNSSLVEVGGDAVLYFSENSTEDLSEKIKLLLNNESLQKELSIKGKSQSKKFSWDKFVSSVVNEL